MKRRYLWGLLCLPFLVGAVRAETKKSGKYVVPKDVKLIRVRSYVDGKEVLDTNFHVDPGQVFIIEAA